MISDEEMLEDYELAVKTSSTHGVCFVCNGHGYWTTEELVCYHKGDYETHIHRCETCQSRGFVLTITKEVVAVPKGYCKTSPRTFYQPYDPVEETKRKIAKD